MERAILRRNLDDVRARIAAACARAGRSPDDVLLVAVTKTVGIEEVRILKDLGVTHIGENRVAEAARKQAELGGTLGLAWHMIGHLQRRKVRDALPLFARIDSVDSPRLAREIDKRAAAQALTVPILLECNVSGETSKYGLSATDLPVRPHFAALRALAEAARRRTALPLPHLSMGMTQDFEVAIEEGATMVRVGSALFREMG